MPRAVTDTDTLTHKHISCCSPVAKVFCRCSRCSAYAAPARPAGPAESGGCRATSLHAWLLCYSTQTQSATEHPRRRRSRASWASPASPARASSSCRPSCPAATRAAAKAHDRSSSACPSPPARHRPAGKRRRGRRESLSLRTFWDHTHTDTLTHKHISCCSPVAEAFRSSSRCSAYAAPPGQESCDIFCLVGPNPNLEDCVKFELSTQSGHLECSLRLAPGTYEVKVNHDFVCE